MDDQAAVKYDEPFARFTRPWVSDAEICEELGIASNTLLRLRKQGKWKVSFRVGVQNRTTIKQAKANCGVA